jgi:hypothetical protein
MESSTASAALQRQNCAAEHLPMPLRVNKKSCEQDYTSMGIG